MANVDFSAIINDFLTAELGEDVRDSLVAIARALQEAINAQLISVTSDLTSTDANAALSVKALADILYGYFSTDRTKLTPSVNSHFDLSGLGDDETFDVKNLPYNSHIYRSTNKLTNIPEELKELTQTVYVVRIPTIKTGHTGMMFAYGMTSKRAFFCDFNSNSGDYQDDPPVWKELPLDAVSNKYKNYPASAFPHGKDYDGEEENFPTIDGMTEQGIYTVDNVQRGDAWSTSLDGFPFKLGTLCVINWASTGKYVIQIALGYQTPRVLIRYGARDDKTGIYTWRGFYDFIDGDKKKDDWLITSFDVADGQKWWTPKGEHYGIGMTTEPIQVFPGQVLYGMWFGGDVPQSCGGAFLSTERNWLAPILFPFGGGSGENTEEVPYNPANVTPGDTVLRYAKLWKITVPDKAYYVSLNLRAVSSEVRNCQSLSTLPIIGATDTGNRVWRADDPQRAQKHGRKLYIIGQSGVSIDRAYRNIYDAATETDQGSQVIVGWQEYILPYYDEGNVVSLGFQGRGYRDSGAAWSDGDPATQSIYRMIKDAQDILDGESAEGRHPYTIYETETLRDADEVYIGLGSNNTTLATLGEYDSTDITTMFGAINALIDLIVEKNNKPVVFFIETASMKRPPDDPVGDLARQTNENVRKLAASRGLVLIDLEAMTGMNPDNYAKFCYDANRFPPYGTHMNNAGNRIRGYSRLTGLMQN